MMEPSFTPRNLALQPPSPAETPSMRYPNHAPAILNPKSNDSYYHHVQVGPREAAATTSTAAPPSTAHSSSLIAQPQSLSSASASASSITNRASTIPPPLSFSTSRDSKIASISILTRPAIASEGLSPSPGGNSASSQGSQPGGGGNVYYTHAQAPSWNSGNAQTQSYSYASASHHAASGSSSLLTQPSPTRQSVYGNMQFLARQTNMAADGENLPNPPSYQEHPTFPAPFSAGGGSLGASYSQAPAASTHHAPSQSVLNHQNSNGTQPPTQTHQSANPVPPQSGHDGSQYNRPPPTQNSYCPSSTTPQQGSYQAFAHHSPTTHSPTTTGGPSRGLGAYTSSMAAPYGGPGGLPTPPMGQYRPNYPMPHGAVLSNIHNPGTPLHVVGGGLHGYSHHYALPHGHQPYLGHGHQRPAQQDRPFRCDVCSQSFNRNHDLKRHKRIHLAVKPFPCPHCDKSFSRKDALKRHTLVKGCGSRDRETTEKQPHSSVDRRGSPTDRKDGASENSEAMESVKTKQEEL